MAGSEAETAGDKVLASARFGSGDRKDDTTVGKDVVVFVGPGLLAFEQMCGVLQRAGVETHWVGFPFSPGRMLRSRLITRTHNARSVEELRQVLLGIGAARILDIQASEFVFEQVAEAALSVGLRPELAAEIERRRGWLDKRATMDALEAAGIPVPARFHGPDPVKAVEALGLPLVVKGRVANGGVSVRVCHTSPEVAEAYRVLAADGGVFAEEFCQGEDGFCYVCCHDGGDVLVDGVYRGLRSQGSVSQFGELGPLDLLLTLDEPELVEVGRAVVRAVGGHGLLNLDVIRTAKGPRVVDVNQRPWASVVALRSTGIDFVDAWLAAERHQPWPFRPLPAGRSVRVFAVSAIHTGFQRPVSGLAQLVRDGARTLPWTGSGYVVAEVVRASAVVARHWTLQVLRAPARRRASRAHRLHENSRRRP